MGAAVVAVDEQARTLEPAFDAAFARRESVRAHPGIVIYAICIGVGLIQPVAALILYLVVAIFYGFTSQGWGTKPGDDSD
ncbi:hypothetical protein [Nocardia sp. NPDC051463]|uniref:hypothetical protein n=1 Tax=Nocardia sp. NPDC051463 TaxID=3154845 RepID=UPI003432C1FB